MTYSRLKKRNLFDSSGFLVEWTYLHDPIALIDKAKQKKKEVKRRERTEKKDVYVCTWAKSEASEDSQALVEVFLAVTSSTQPQHQPQCTNGCQKTGLSQNRQVSSSNDIFTAHMHLQHSLLKMKHEMW